MVVRAGCSCRGRAPGDRPGGGRGPGGPARTGPGRGPDGAGGGGVWSAGHLPVASVECKFAAGVQRADSPLSRPSSPSLRVKVGLLGLLLSLH